MGLFKQMKQMKDSLQEAPDLIRSAMDMQQAASDAAAVHVPSATSPDSPGAASTDGASLDGQTISNVSLARYAEICRTGTERGVTDLSGVASIAAEFGVSAADWDEAVAGWNARFVHDTPAAMRFNALWRGVS